VPVEINSLGFRDTRDYSLDKPPGTFRILVLGDSVTFGHGALSDTTYPFLLEQRLKKWRPDVGWQVWNLGVPGYNTSQELEVLKQVAPRYQPDLVIVGFYENDLSGNELPRPPSLTRRLGSAIQRTMQRRLYSYELYKKIALTIRWQWLAHSPDRGRIEGLAAEEALLNLPADRSGVAAQRLTAVDTVTDVNTFSCLEADRSTTRDRLTDHLAAQSAEMDAWRQAVASFQQINRDGPYRVVFFINMAPNECPGVDHYYDGGAVEDEDALRKILGKGAPVTGSVRAFLRYRPSQMPGASGHSIGNANRVKADALFEFLASGVLPQALPR
jgi:lysophospholipase L1-like esterase